MYEKNVTIKVSGKDAKEVARKILKVHYLLSFMRNDKSNLLSTIAFLVIAILFLAFVFF
jgi:hypothetical protein